MTHSLKHTVGAAIFAATAWTSAAPAYGNVGTTVTNIASVTFTAGDVEGTLQTNAAVFTIQAPDTCLLYTSPSPRDRG